MAEAWLINPRKSTRRKSRRREMRPRIKVSMRKRRGRLGNRSPLKGFKINRRKGTYTMARKRRRARIRSKRRYRRNRAMQVNRRTYRRRRRSYRRRAKSYRRNPPAMQTLGPELGWATVGFIATKFTGNMISPMLAGITGGGDVMRIGVKFGVAYLAAWMLEMFIGKRVFIPTFVGGSLDAIQDAVKTFIAPTFPQLAEEPLALYYEPGMIRRPTVGEYYQPQTLGADAYDYAT